MGPQLGMFDAAVVMCGGKEYSISVLDKPHCLRVPADDIPNPITLREFVDNVCRDPQGQKTVAMIMHYQESVAEFRSASAVGL